MCWALSSQQSFYSKYLKDRLTINKNNQNKLYINTVTTNRQNAPPPLLLPTKKIQYTFTPAKTPATCINTQTQYLLYNIKIFAGDKS
jgi:hypothetical protein